VTGAEGALHVEVVFALPEQQELVGLEVTEGTTVAQAIEQSGIAGRFPQYDLSSCAVGVWGQLVERDRRLQDGDRVELYRPLQMDPQDARRELAAKGKSMRKR
jgi:uncharacterized protein